MPFPLELSPALDGARRHLSEWSQAIGFLSEGVWDEDKLASCDLPLCAAGLDPDATQEQLNLASNWLAFGTYGDDYYPLVYGHRRDLAAARLTTARLSASCMPLDAEPVPPPANAMERSLIDLWAHDGRHDARGAAPAEVGRRQDDRGLGVGAGQPDPEPGPRPGGLPGDAARHLRFRPHPGPVPRRTRPGRYRPRSTAAVRSAPWRTRRSTTRASSTTSSPTRRRSSTRARSTTRSSSCRTSSASTTRPPSASSRTS